MHRRALDLAPEDVTTLRSLADVYALGGQADEQLRLLKRVLELRPQEKDVREYVAHTEPSRPRADEAYARPASEFLKLRDRARGRTQPAHARRPPSHDGFPQRPREPLPPDRVPAAHRRRRRRGARVRLRVRGRHRDGAAPRRASVHREERPGRRGDRERRRRRPTIPSMAMYTSARAFYVHFPRLDPGDVVELLYRVEDVAAAQRVRRLLRRGRLHAVDRADRAHASTCSSRRRSRTFYFNKPNVAGPRRRTSKRRATRRSGASPRENVAAARGRADDAARRRDRSGTCTSRPTRAGTTWAAGTGASSRTSSSPTTRSAGASPRSRRASTDDKAKVRAVYDFVVQKTRYVALEFGIHGFKPYRCAQIFARGFGDCKDKATLIVTMLKELGIPATIVIVRTGMRGDFETEPASLAPFDHAIAYVPSLDLYLDGTAEYTGLERAAVDGPRRARAADQRGQAEARAPARAHRGGQRRRASTSRRRSAPTAPRRSTGRSTSPARRPARGARVTTRRRRRSSACRRTSRAELPGVEIASVDVERSRGRRAEGADPREGEARRATRGATASRGRSRSARRSTWFARGRRSRRAGATCASTRSRREENETRREACRKARRSSRRRIAAEGKSPFGFYKVDVETSVSRASCA